VTDICAYKLSENIELAQAKANCKFSAGKLAVEQQQVFHFMSWPNQKTATTIERSARCECLLD